MTEQMVCTGCGKKIGPRHGCRFNQQGYWHVDNRRDCEFPDRGPIEDPSLIKIGFDLECRGRNGWFVARHVEAFTIEQTSYVRIYSKQTARTAPAQLAGNRDSLISLLREVIEGLGGENV